MNIFKEDSGAVTSVRVGFWFRKSLGWLTGLVLFFMMSLTTVDVIARFVFSKPLSGTFELMEFSLAIVIFSVLPLVTWDRDHISVSLFDGFFRGALRRLQQILITGFSVVAMSVITVRMWMQGVQLDETGATTGFLLWPRAPIAFFMSTFAGLSCLILIGLFFYACAGKIYPDYQDNQ
jgi:TRAP-type C4-dicarboxylate transport system permease small subunit